MDLHTLVLKHGHHASRASGVCAMEAVAWLAGEKHSDAPACACPVVTRYVQLLNDARWSSDAARTAALLPWLACAEGETARPCILGSRVGPATERARARWLVERALTWWAPLAGQLAIGRLEARGYDCTEMRAAFLALAESPSRETARRARDAAAAAYAAAYAAYAADAADAAAAAAADAADAAAAAAAYAAYAAAYAAYAAADAADAAAYAAADARRARRAPRADAAADAADAAVRDEMLNMAVLDLGPLLAIKAEDIGPVGP